MLDFPFVDRCSPRSGPLQKATGPLSAKLDPPCHHHGVGQRELLAWILIMALCLGLPNLVTAQAPSSDSLQVTGSDLAVNGAAGGPFTSTGTSYSLTNIGTAPLSWTASNTPSWAIVYPASGTLAPGASTPVTVALDSSAATLPIGAYTGSLVFSDTTSGAQFSHPVRLTILGSPTLSVSSGGGLLSYGKPGGPFSPNSVTYTLTNNGAPSLTWTASPNVTWLTLSSTGGTLPAGASTTVTATINSNANSLAQNTYTGSTSFTNTTNGIGSTTATATLVVTTQQAVTLPTQATSSGSTYFGYYQGYWFTAPTACVLSGLQVVGSGNQSIAVVRLSTAPVGVPLATSYSILYLTLGNTSTGIIPTGIPINQGDKIGIIGFRGGAITLGTSPFTTQILGHSVSLSSLESNSFNSSGVGMVSAGTGFAYVARITPYFSPPSPTLPVINSPVYAQVNTGQTLSYQISATNQPTSYAATGLPSGVTLNTTTGLISGTPTTAGTYPVNLGATNAAGSGTMDLQLTVNAVIACTPTTLSQATAGAAYDAAISATGGNTPYSSIAITNVSSGGTGLDASCFTTSITTQKAVLSGIPTAPGTLSFTVKITDAQGIDFSQNYSLIVNSPLSASPATLPSGAVGSAYNQVITFSGGTTPLTNIAVSNLNAGATGLTMSNFASSLNGETLTVIGTATNAGTATFQIAATDSAGATLTQNYSITFQGTGTATPQIQVQQQSAGSPLVSGAGSVNFGSPAIGTATSQSFTIVNLGTTPLSLNQFTLTGVNAADFNLGTAPLETLAPGATASFIITYTPTLATAETATLHIFSTDPNTPRFDIPLSGNLLTPLHFATNMAASVVVGQASFTAQSTTYNQSTMRSPYACAVSSTGQLAVCDNTADRVLIWNSIPAANGQPADVVVGKVSFTDSTNAATAALTGPCTGVAFSPNGQQLLVADGQHNRVLIWNNIPTANGTPADVVIGQSSFSTSQTGTSATNLDLPRGLSVTPSGQLLIADTSNNRILVYNSIPTVNGAAADYVIGQASMTTHSSGSGAAQLSGPSAIAMAPSGQLLVMDSNNNRVLVFAGVPTANGIAASTVIGQTDFGLNTSGISATQLSAPAGLAVSPTGQVAISDLEYRVLLYQAVPTANGAAASVVLGQPNFTSSTYEYGGISATSFYMPMQVCFSPDGRLLVPDNYLYRLMIFGQPGNFSAPAITSILTPSGPVSQAFTYQITASNNPTSFGAVGLPSGLTLDTTTGIISGTPNFTSSTNVTIFAASPGGMGSATLNLTITPPIPTISSPTLSGTAGVYFGYYVSASNSPTSYTATGLPPGLSFNSSSGQILGTPTTAGTYNVTLGATNAAGTATATQVITIQPGAPTFVGGFYEDSAYVGVPYSSNMAITGYPATFTASNLPPNFSINPSTGQISGTPTATGIVTISLAATNSSGSATSQLLLSVENVASAFTCPLTASGGIGSPFSFAVTTNPASTTFSASGLPPGLSINTSTGVISGTPTAPGTYNATITAAATSTVTSSTTLAITIGLLPPLITSSLSTAAVVNQPFSYYITASGVPSNFTATGLPPGLTYNTATGLISGTPTNLGTSNVTLSATNSAGTGTANLTLTCSSTAAPASAILYYGDGYVAQGSGGWLTPATGNSFSANAPYESPTDIGIQAQNANNVTWTTQFAAPTSGAALALKTYNNIAAIPWQTSTSPGFDFEGNSRGEGTLTGSFTILDVSFGASNTVTSFAADFIEYDEGNTANWTIGSVRYNSTVPLIPPPAPTVTNPVATAGANGTNLSGIINSSVPGVQYYFRYGTDATYGYASAIQSFTYGGASTPVNIPISGLKPGTTYHYQLVATSIGGTAVSTDATFTTLSSSPALPAITSATYVNTTEGAAFSYQITANNSPYLFTASSLPSGLVLNGLTGVISGTVTANPTLYEVPISATNDSGTASVTLMLSVNNPLALSSNTWPTAVANAPYSQFQLLSGGTVPYTSLSISNFSNGGTGMTATNVITNPTNGTITVSGTPTAVGAFSFTVNAVDSAGATLSQTYTITVNPSITISPTVLATGIATQAYSQTFTASGGAGSYTTSLGGFNGGTTGLTAASFSNIGQHPTFQGTPTTAGVASFYLTVTDQQGASATQYFTINVYPATSSTPKIFVAQASGTPLFSSASTVPLASSGIGLPVTQSLVIKNAGNASLQFGGPSVFITGANAADFSISATGLTDLAPSASTSIAVTYTPSTSSLETATLTLSSNDPSTPSFSVSLTGSVQLAYLSGMAANLVVGQPNFLSQSTTVSQSITPGPCGCAISSTGKLAVCDQTGKRVLIWNSLPTSMGQPADVVVGKASFTDTSTGPTAILTGVCSSVAFSPDGNTLLVADSNNDRVLIWNPVPTSSGAPANVVVGQSSFTSSGGSTGASSLNNPTGVLVTPAGQLVISDSINNRILIYPAIPTSNGASAAQVIGQSTFYGVQSGTAASQVLAPKGLALSPSGQLIVADSANNRVLIFPNDFGAGNLAAVVIGQPGFGVITTGVSASALHTPTGVAVSPTGQLAISDSGNNRVLIYNSIPANSGAAADEVLGQPNFTSQTAFYGGVNASSMSSSGQPAFSADGRLFVPGASMSRVMVFGPALPSIASPGTVGTTLGQPFALAILATGNPSAFSVSGLPTGLSYSNTSGLIYGTPTAIGTATLQLSATNAEGTGIGTMTLNINSAISIAPSALPTAVANTAYSQSAGFSGGTLPYTSLTITGFNGGSTGLTASAITTNSSSGAVVISATPSAPGAASFTVNVIDSVGASLSQTYNINVITAQQNWRQTWFGTTANTGNAADTACPAGDGISNLMKFATAMNPTAPGANPGSVSSSGPNIVFTYTRSVAAMNAGTTYTVQWSNTLEPGSWSTAGVTETYVNQGTTQLVTDTLPAGANGHRFVQLVVTGP